MGCRERKIHVGGEHLLCLMSLMIMVSRLAISLWREEGGREGGRRWVISFHVLKVDQQRTSNSSTIYYHYLPYC